MFHTRPACSMQAGHVANRQGMLCDGHEIIRIGAFVDATVENASQGKLTYLLPKLYGSLSSLEVYRNAIQRLRLQRLRLER